MGCTTLHIPITSREQLDLYYPRASRTTEPLVLYSTIITLISYGSYRVYTASVPEQYSYIFNPSIGRIDSTEHQ